MSGCLADVQDKRHFQVHEIYMVQNAQDPCKLKELGWNPVDTGSRPETERKFDAVYSNCVQADWRTTMFPLLREMRHAFDS
jgi:hypothetical protein